MRFLILSGLIASVAIPAAGLAQTSPPAAAAAAHYTSEDTELGILLDDPAAKAVLTKYIPKVISSDQIDMARGMTLKTVQSYASDQLSDATLVAIDADLAKLPVKK